MARLLSPVCLRCSSKDLRFPVQLYVRRSRSVRCADTTVLDLRGVLLREGPQTLASPLYFVFNA